YSAWDTPRHPDGGLWRLRRRYWTWHDQVLFYRQIPLRWPVPRAVPKMLELRAGSQWKIYARHHVELLLRLMDENPDLIRCGRTTRLPDESFGASMLGSPGLVGSETLPACYDSPWYLDWGSALSSHPRWLTSADFDRLAQARRAEPSEPATAFAATS